MSRFTAIPPTTTLADLAAIQANWDKADADMTTESTARSAADNTETDARIAADLAHINSIIAHLATAIVFNSGSSGISATDVDAALKWINARVSTIIASSGTSSTEVVDGRTLETGYTPNRTITLLGDVLRDMQSRLNVINTSTANLKHGLQQIVASQAGPLIPTVYGRTLVNILGKDGNCESVASWTAYNGATKALNTTNVKYGSNSISFTCVATSNQGIVKNIVNLTLNSYYLVCGEFLNGTTAGARIQFYDGTTVSNGNIVTSTTDFLISYTTIQYTTGTPQIFAYSPSPNVAGQVGYVDGIRIFEITSTEKTAINAMDTATAQAYIAANYPYVDSVQHVRYPAITKYGKNLLPDFTQWTLHANAVATAPYSLTLNATAAQQKSNFDLTLLSSTTYNLSATLSSSSGYIEIWSTTNGTDTTRLLTTLGSSGSVSLSFTTTSGTTYRVYANSNASGAYTFTNPQLELGSTATPFEARNDDYLYGITDSLGNPLKLGSDVSRTVCDSLTYRDGAWWLTKRWKKDVALDGSFAWTFDQDYTGFKRFHASISPAAAKQGSGVGAITKYNGSILQPNDAAVWTAGDQFLIGTGASHDNVIVTVSDTDSGWDNAYIPIATEQSAFISYGWRVNGYTTGTTATDEASGSIAAAGTYALTHAGKYKSVTITKSSDNVTYSAAVEGTDYTINYNLTNALLTNSTAGALYYKITYTYGVVANSWVSVVDGTTAPGTNTIAFVSANQAVGYTPYSLSYQLAVSTEEIVNVEGSIGLQSGGNQISVGEGIIDREIVTPQNFSVDYFIDDTRVPLSYTKYRPSKILAIYKNGVIDNKWVLNFNDVVTNGLFKSYILNADYDPTAVYTVTYVALDKYLMTGNLVSVDVSYQSNPSMTINSLVKKAADDEASISVLQETRALKNQLPWIAPTMLNAWVNFGGTDAVAGYMKDEFGFTNVKGRIKTGTIGQTAFTLPAGYRPKETQRFTVSSNALFGEVIVNSDGTVVPTVGSNTSFNVQIRFRAEQ